MRYGVCIIGAGLWLAVSAAHAQTFVPGVVPDWEQPWFYSPPGPGAGPPWAAWCAPTSAANLCGHWEDTYGRPVGDGMVFPATPAWGAVSWHDYEADATRPAPATSPPFPTDLGWYMDTNNFGWVRPNPAHIGTYLKDIHFGLGYHVKVSDPGWAWTTGTQGKAFAAGLASSGAPAKLHPSPASALAEIVAEINAGRTLIVSWLHWCISNTGLPPVGDVEFWDFDPPVPDPWGNDEWWNFDPTGEGLGHAVTAVGYLLAGDPANPLPGTDWIIVHDNVWQTPVNVAVPFNWNVWVANTNATARTGPVFVPGVVPDWEQPWFYSPPGPGAGPPWQAWCAPTSAANLCGHWDDTYGFPVADAMVWPTAPPWPSFDWQDFEADAGRPPRGPLPPPGPTDLGWHMDTNWLGTTTWGNPGPPGHTGTYLKDVDTGLGSHLTFVDPASGWTTGTQGKAFAAGLASSGAPAALHLTRASALAEIVGEINAGRTLIISWYHWDINKSVLPPVGGVEFWDFREFPRPDPWGNEEKWNFKPTWEGLGHAVTAVGYLLAADPVNPRPGTDWIIVHDNVWQTPVNVAVPLSWRVWVANTNATARTGPVFVPGVVPDWEQPWFYTLASPNGGPGPGAGPPWDAWCAPTSAANLCGHWDDTYGLPVADGMVWPTALFWPSFDWQDYEADAGRPPRGPLPPAGPTDLGWHMDTNWLGTTTWGNPGPPGHTGTYLKDIDTGLGSHLTFVDPASGWTTGTQGKAYAAGLASSRAPAATHPGPGPAFAEIVGEIKAGRTLIVSWLHWYINPSGLPPVGDVEFYDFNPSPGPDPWGNHEEWNFDPTGEGLGHAVTAVGYLLGCDPKNPRPGTDWIIVHDNVWQTPVNVAVPFDWNVWVANTNATPLGARIWPVPPAPPWDVETIVLPPPGDNRQLGVAYGWGYYWTTGAGHTTTGANHRIHQFDGVTGAYLASYPQVVTGTWGGRDIAIDGAGGFLYTGNEGGNVQQHQYTGNPPPASLVYVQSCANGALGIVRALCIDDEGKFWTTDLNGPIWRFDFTCPTLTILAGPGARIGSPVANTGMYGFGWDVVDNKCIWSHGQSGAGMDAFEWEVNKVTANLTYTGRSFVTGAPGDRAGGAEVYCGDPHTPDLAMVALGQGTPDSIGVYNLLKQCGPPCPGDFNCDGVRDFADIDEFVAVLGGAPCKCPNPANCDPNGDGVTNFDDIDPFIALLGVPCP